MKTMNLTDAQGRLSELVDSLVEGPVLLLRRGRPCAALVGLAEPFDREAFLLGRNKRLRQLMDKACQRARGTGGIPFSEILAEIDQRPRVKSRPARGDHRRR